MGGGESKTEKATPKRRRDERKKGNVLLSRDMVAIATLFGSIFMLRMMFVTILTQIGVLFDTCFSFAANTPVGGIQSFLGEMRIQAPKTLLLTAGPLLLVTALLAVSATFAQTRFLVAGESLKPKLERINPLEGFKRLFSLRSIVEALKGILKITILIYIIYNCLIGFTDTFTGYLYADLSGGLSHLFGQVFSMMLRIGLAFLALAGLDYLYQWWDFERKLKMSKQEIKEEYKQTEGDPKIKGKIRELQRRMAQSRMMSQVPKADVIIRNPTHFAVALRYKPDEDNAPIVLAKGQDQLALRIISVAEEHAVSIIENPPLARLLYAGVEVDREIPPDLYSAVAEVMVYLFKLDREAKSGLSAKDDTPLN